jgi:putative hydrolase
MRIFADYHTHTIYSHGKGTIRQNVDEAVRKGLREIVITDHGPGHFTYGVKRKNFKKMREEIDKLSKEYNNIKIMLGVEANLISCDGDIDVNEEDMKYFDKLLVGYHNGAVPKSFGDLYKLFIRNQFSKVLPFLRSSNRKIITDAMIKAINRYDIDIITHPGAKADINTKELARAAAKRGTLLEINSSHGYMTVEYVKIAMSEGANFAIDSDAHIPENVGNCVKGINVAIKAGLPVERIANAEE